MLLILCLGSDFLSFFLSSIATRLSSRLHRSLSLSLVTHLTSKYCVVPRTIAVLSLIHALLLSLQAVKGDCASSGAAHSRGSASGTATAPTSATPRATAADTARAFVSDACVRGLADLSYTCHDLVAFSRLSNKRRPVGNFTNVYPSIYAYINTSLSLHVSQTMASRRLYKHLGNF